MMSTTSPFWASAVPALGSAVSMTTKVASFRREPTMCVRSELQALLLQERLAPVGNELVRSAHARYAAACARELTKRLEHERLGSDDRRCTFTGRVAHQLDAAAELEHLLGERRRGMSG